MHRVLTATALLSAILALASLGVAQQPDRVQDLAGTGTDLHVVGRALGDAAGKSVVAADVNADGIDDLVVGAPDVDHGGRTDVGAVYVIYGRRSFTGNQVIKLATAVPDLTLIGDAKDDHFGTQVAVGDVNGDGRADIVATSWGKDTVHRVDCGAVHVIYGSASPSTLLDLSLTAADLTVLGGASTDELGRTMALGDLNNDGIQDLCMGAPGADPGQRGNAGAVHVVFGSKSFAKNAVVDLSTGLADVSVYGRYQFNYLSSGLATGDFNNDGVDDLLVGAKFASVSLQQAGEAYVFFGRSLWSTPFIFDIGTGAKPDFRVIGHYSFDNLSTALDVADVDGDGKNDLLVTALGASHGPVSNRLLQAGEANVIFGRAFAPRQVWDLGTTAPDIRMLGRAAGDRLGWSGALVDLDGDGAAEVVAAASDASPLNRSMAGSVFAMRGAGITTPTTLDLSTASAGWEIHGAVANERIAPLALASGDVNGDGHPDLIMGTPDAAGGIGGVRVLYGGFAFTAGTPRVGTRLPIVISARGFPNTYRLGAAAFSGFHGIPVDSRRLPLDPDPLFFTSLNTFGVFLGYQGYLSATGQATAAINIPSLPALVGVSIYSAFALLDVKAPSGAAALGNRMHITFVQ